MSVKRKRRKRSTSSRLTVYIDPSERAEMVKWLGSRNWSEMVSAMFRAEVERAKASK